MKTRAKGAQVQKAKAPDPGAYGEDDITPEDRKRAKDAKAQAADGQNPPSWVADEETWSRAKEAADKSYDEGDDAYWPAVVHIYGNMGGEIQTASKKAMQPKGKMKAVAGMMADMDMDAEMMADATDMDVKRVEELMRGDDEPTDDEVSAMMSAMKQKTEKAFDALLSKYGTSEGASAGHATQGHAGEGGSGKIGAGEYNSVGYGMLSSANDTVSSALAEYEKNEGKASAFHRTLREEVDRSARALDRNLQRRGEYDSIDVEPIRQGFSELKRELKSSALLLGKKGLTSASTKLVRLNTRLMRDVEREHAKFGKAMHAHADMADVVGMMSDSGMSDADMVEASGLDAARVKALLHDGEKPTTDELTAMTDACEECEKAVKAKSDKPSHAVASESLLKAELGMSDSEFRRQLSQAVYARWGKQAEVNDVFPETQVALVKAWEGDVWMSGFRLLSVPYDAEDGAVTLGEVSGEVRQTYEPVAKSESAEPDDAPCEVEYVANRDRGGYVIGGLNGEAVTLAKSLMDTGVSARVEIDPNGPDGSRRVWFASHGAVCKQLAVRATVEGEFDAEPRSFFPYLRDEVSMRKAEEKGIVYAVVYEPDVVDKQGEYATADDIEEAAHEYLKRSRRMKRQHDEHSDSEIVESYIVQADFFLGNRMVRKGSWVIAEKLGEKSKKLYKEGKLTGVSMGGTASYAA